MVEINDEVEVDGKKGVVKKLGGTYVIVQFEGEKEMQRVSRSRLPPPPHVPTQDDTVRKSPPKTEEDEQ